ncbi:hypothetical protein GLYMA_02G035200v4 [Glycine max]|uniref:Uncharacterized protein n=2 Tax=Glycine subgen. Soja TaxID=1462606 RepID=I1JC29_SOYBN|nr:uncharacterized protein LOC100776669 [Glycine max]XP_028195126.1 uncharacterized protein LOC114380320 [Glycine soja]KAG5062066.1 hypothetical protein JHK85_003249 [Glycine max]KAG5079023.1 hypothetical protein JHK86_003088 [Glycine max]KAH1260096.1 hypothetical protein GmHk_02G003305 [Glycine max]KRH69570.1 hypothetical protein GLYMA_02G035200v4 [Glycine max]RZC23235.1 hypothetical protein D0Y65_002864 [Glycine soja]|eukprot:XP_003519935.1 uncharacterized protein LOC100776669 [Glycine max]
MQAVSLSPLSSRDSSDEFAGKFEHDFVAKLKINENENEEKHNEDEVEEEEEFSFVLTNSDGSPISAEDAFDNGHIRPIFPIFNQDLLFSDDYNGGDGLRLPIKVFVEHADVSPSPSEATTPAEGTYCEWNPKAAVKSNSTGFSKLWRFRDVKLRSNSDGKDAFVFLNHAPAAKPAEKASSVVVKKVEVKKGKTTTAAASAHEKHYVMSRARKESDKRKSYLPYKQDLFGFFANASGLSRNVHPY